MPTAEKVQTNERQVGEALDGGERKRRHKVWDRLRKRGWIYMAVGAGLIGLGLLTFNVPFLGIGALALGAGSISVGSYNVILGGELKSSDKSDKQ